MTFGRFGSFSFFSLFFVPEIFLCIFFSKNNNGKIEDDATGISKSKVQCSKAHVLYHECKQVLKKKAFFFLALNYFYISNETYFSDEILCFSCICSKHRLN